VTENVEQIRGFSSGRPGQHEPSPARAPTSIRQSILAAILVPKTSLKPNSSKAALDQLAEYDWPRNMCELQNTIERAIILWSEGPLTFDLPSARTRKPTGTRRR
jgi:transcriptional regulator of acetoin/glycerol metabolism